MTKRKQFLLGMRAGIPVIFGFIPVVIAFAIAARQAGFSILETQLMSLSVFAGASRIMAAGMFVCGAVAALLAAIRLPTVVSVPGAIFTNLAIYLVLPLF